MLELITGPGNKRTQERRGAPTASNFIPVVRERAINRVETEEKELLRASSCLSSRVARSRRHEKIEKPGKEHAEAVKTEKGEEEKKKNAMKRREILARVRE